MLDSRDGRAYPTVTIGNREWMAGNLAHASSESWCFEDEATDCDTNGRLYTWSAALSACPAGWTLASDADWIDLELALGMSAAEAGSQGPRGSNQGAQLRSGGETGFDAPICGYRRPDGSFVRRNERAAFWTASEHGQEDAWHRDIRSSVGTIYRSPVTKTYALSVRCVRQSTSHSLDAR
jgi:uncharacterized protein (TIGR02145 family)